MPACSLCVRIGRLCDYEQAPQQPPSADEFAALQQKVTELERQLSSAGATSNQASRSNSASQSSNGQGIIGAGYMAPYYGQLGSLVAPSSPWSLTPDGSTFPSLFFLDSDAFRYEQLSIQKPHVRVPPEVLEALGGPSELRDMIETYFLTTHTWLPMSMKLDS